MDLVDSGLCDSGKVLYVLGLRVRNVDCCCVV